MAQADAQDPSNMVDIYTSAATVYEDHVLFFPSFYMHAATKQSGSPKVSRWRHCHHFGRKSMSEKRWQQDYGANRSKEGQLVRVDGSVE